MTDFSQYVAGLSADYENELAFNIKSDSSRNGQFYREGLYLLS